jgi:hypothetical protein
MSQQTTLRALSQLKYSPQAASVHPCKHDEEIVQHMKANVVEEQLATWKKSDKYKDKDEKKHWGFGRKGDRMA